MRIIVITITLILLAFCFFTAAQEGKVAKENTAKESPDIVVIEKLSDKYSPVIFKHKSHLQAMTVMGIECSTCHHYSPSDYFPPCRKCHSQTRGEIKSNFPLARPSLEGAYHQKCIGCHREWSLEIECSVCHVKKVAGEPDKSKTAAAEIVDWEHPVMEADDSKVYKTEYNGNTTVTFLHKEHGELFGIECVDCHQAGGCSLCHEEEKPKEAANEELEHHKLCVSCHPLEHHNCQQCHTDTVKQGFDHEQRSGWALGEEHIELNCRRCHITKGKFDKLETECDVCHSGKEP